eukprot:1082398-Amphidinium_carterae.1
MQTLGGNDMQIMSEQCADHKRDLSTNRRRDMQTIGVNKCRARRRVQTKLKFDSLAKGVLALLHQSIQGFTAFEE